MGGRRDDGVKKTKDREHAPTPFMTYATRRSKTARVPQGEGLQPEQVRNWDNRIASFDVLLWHKCVLWVVRALWTCVGACA